MEAVVSLALGVLLLSTVAGLVGRQRLVLEALARRAEAVHAARVARMVLGAEARFGDPSADGWGVARDTLGLRAYRGIGLVCSGSRSVDGAPPFLEVWGRGIRNPDPSKDSLVLLGSGPVAVAGLTDVAPSGRSCPGTSVETSRWTLDREPPPGVWAARYFERGSYHVADGALRYRRGRSGRQPLTPSSVDRTSAFSSSESGIVLELVVGGASAPSWRIWLAAAFR